MADQTAGSSGAGWTVITVTYNSASALRRCWAEADLGAARWLVVDNASSDESVETARELGADVMEVGRNSGFSVANNMGLAAAEGDWVAFVNPDVTLRAATDLDRLAQLSVENDALVVPQLLNADGSEQPNARGLPFPSAKLAHRGVALRGAHLEDYVRTGLARPTYIAWAMGAAYAGPTALFRDLGGWDERYFVYYEDHDLGLRSWLAGHPVVLDPEVRWVHEWQRATTRLSAVAWRNELRSATIFYSTYPTLIRHKGGWDPRFRLLRRRLWAEAADC